MSAVSQSQEVWNKSLDEDEETPDQETLEEEIVLMDICNGNSKSRSTMISVN